MNFAKFLRTPFLKSERLLRKSLSQIFFSNSFFFNFRGCQSKKLTFYTHSFCQNIASFGNYRFFQKMRQSFLAISLLHKYCKNILKKKNFFGRELTLVYNFWSLFYIFRACQINLILVIIRNPIPLLYCINSFFREEDIAVGGFLTYLISIDKYVKLILNLQHLVKYVKHAYKNIA